jgi:hypothetical protein
MADFTVLPPITDHRWSDVAAGKITKKWEMLAMKILMIRVIHATKADPSPSNLQKYAQEIRTLFEKNLKAGQNDLHTIFG